MAIGTTTGEAAAVARDRYEAVIGIEVHCQLRTASKMFCACSTAYDGAAPNSHVCPVCLGLPGALPVINRRAVEHVLATGLAIEATTPDATRWDRKNYFYPDLPKGYQISQYDLPLASAGRLAIETSEGPFTVGITRAHLEEDTAKLVHATDADGRKVSLVDFNRSGAPLMEIVTDPDIRTAEQARRYAEELQLLLRTIGASDADMERGQMRVEANVSLRERGTEAFGTRVEVKNMNSFRSVERAIEYEIDRQAAALDASEPLAQETRGWSDDRGETYRMRSKETSDDYRYFPEPDLPPLHVDPAWLETLRAGLPELPAARRTRYGASLGLGPYDAGVLTSDPDATALFEATLGRRSVTRPEVGRELGHRGVPAPAQHGRGGHHGPGRGCRARGDRPGGRGRIDLARERQGGVRSPRRYRRGGGGHHRGPRFPPDHGHGCRRRGRGRRHRREPGRGRRLSGRQGPGGRLPRGPGDEGDARPGQRRPGPGRRPRAPRPDGVGERMGPINLLLWGAGVALVAIGYTRARGPWSRYQALKAQDENVARYESWRGGLRTNESTGASVAMAILRRQAQMGAAIAIVGAVLIFLGFLIK